MGKTLIIAEKPSVAAELSRALARAPGISKFEKHKDKGGDWYENDTHMLSSAIGHLVELELPTQDGKKLKWGMDNLPIIPESFSLRPIEKTKGRFNLLARLMKKADLIVNACDAGREGELIFRYLVEKARVSVPVKRLWMQSMTAEALVEAFTHLRSDEEMLPLADAAKCRSESDWLVGINGTRALTAFNSRHGGFVLTPVGRVQTPTLSILVKREKDIQSFVSRPYFEVHADFDVAAGTYASRWFDEAFRKSEDAERKAERLWTRPEAESVVERCRGAEGVVEETSRPKKQSPPLLYDLTSLQRDGSNRFGFSARSTLQIAQSLYEKHKALTYPRTDSRFLPEDYPATVIGTMKSLAEGGVLPAELASFARRVVEEKLVRGGNRRIFNNARVSDHFAIIPTGKAPGKSLSEPERKIYDAVVRRFLAVFFGTAEHLVTTRITRVGADAFRTLGKVLVEPGWLAVYGREAQPAQANGDDEAAASIVPVLAGEKALNSAIEARDFKTKPPPRYNEATLLSAMEGAGKLVEDEELRAAMSERGLGTPATRAQIIEGLIHDKYVQRDGRSLVATAKGIGLVAQLESIGLDTLGAPELTGDWEYRLKQMEHGSLDRDTFMRGIRSMTADMVERTRRYLQKVREQSFPDLDVSCPNPECRHRPLRQTDAHYSCPSCRFRIGKVIAARPLTGEEAKTLLSTGAVGPLEGFRSRFGREFSATLRLDEKQKVAFVFEEGAGGATGEGEAVELKDPIAECPLCREAGREGRIHATEGAYVCENFVGGRKCAARLPRTLCRFEIPPEQAVRFFTEGKTEVINRFISKKGRPFSAALVLSPKGKKLIEWEFPPREPRAGGASGKKKAPPAPKAAKGSAKKASPRRKPKAT